MKRKANQYSISLAQQQCLLVAKQDVQSTTCTGCPQEHLEQAALGREKRTSLILALPTECPAFHYVPGGT